jgi:hypothetical protein
MNSSSAQPTCSITSSDDTDTITIDTSSWGSFTAGGVSGSSMDTITLTGAGASTYTIGSAGVSSITLNDINTSEFTWKMPEEWVDSFPDYAKVQEMCDKYPAFKIAFEKFKQIYDLVEDDYEAKKGNKYVP